VLTTDGWLPFKKKYFGSNPELFEEAGRINALADSGRISTVEFISQVASLANIPFDDAKREIQHNSTNTELFDYIEGLSSRYRIGMLSNASDNFLPELFTQEQLSFFTSFSLSCDTGYVKPDARAYNSIVSSLGVSIDECVFVDDQPRYIEGAKDIGLECILYKDLDSMITDLDYILEMTDTDK
jgi:HAD superfamily hydrolase (TIGR01509 family)